MSLEVRGLEHPTISDVWLVDNVQGPGRSAMPEPGASSSASTRGHAWDVWKSHKLPGSCPCLNSDSEAFLLTTTTMTTTTTP